MTTQREDEDPHDLTSKMAFSDMVLNQDGSVMTHAEIVRFRERRGVCSTCVGTEPVQCFILKRSRFNPLLKTKDPITSPGLVYKGICLRCHPEEDPKRKRRKRRKSKPKAAQNVQRKHQKESSRSGKTSPIPPPTLTSRSGKTSPIPNRKESSKQRNGGSSATTARTLPTVSTNSSGGSGSVSRLPEAPLLRQDAKRTIVRPRKARRNKSIGSTATAPVGRVVKHEEHRRWSDTDRMGLTDGEMKQLHLIAAKDDADQHHDTTQKGNQRPHLDRPRETRSEGVRIGAVHESGRPETGKSDARTGIRIGAVHQGGGLVDQSDRKHEVGAVHVNNNEGSSHHQAAKKSESERKKMEEWDKVEMTELDLNKHLTSSVMTPSPEPRTRQDVLAGSEKGSGGKTTFEDEDKLNDLQHVLDEVTHDSVDVPPHIPVDLLVAAMKASPESVAIQEYALARLWELSREDKGIKVAAANAEVLDVVLDAMRTHKRELSIQTSGCGALWTLSVANNKFFEMRSGFCSTILTALWEHPDSEELVTNAFGGLSIVSRMSEMSSATKRRAIEASVQRIMPLHILSIPIQKDGCTILSNIAVDSEEGTVSAVSQEQLDVILCAMKKHPKSEGVQMAACFALKNYTFDENNVRTLRSCSSGDVKELLTFAVGYKDCAVDGQTVLDRVKLSAEEDAATEELVRGNIKDTVQKGALTLEDASEAIGTITDLMVGYSWSSKVQYTGLQGFAKLLKGQPKCKRILGQSRHLNLILDVMVAHKEKVAVQEKGCMTLSRLAQSGRSKTRREMIAAGTLHVLVSLLDDFGENESVLQHAFSILECLTEEPECGDNLDAPEITIMTEIVGRLAINDLLRASAKKSIANLRRFSSQSEDEECEKLDFSQT